VLQTSIVGVVYCTQEHQKSDWVNHKPVCALTKAIPASVRTDPRWCYWSCLTLFQPSRIQRAVVKDIPNRGKGFVATQRIPAGTQIMHVKNCLKSDPYDKDIDPVPNTIVNGLVKILLQNWDNKISGSATWRSLHAVGIEKLKSPHPSFSDEDWSLARAQVRTYY